jgi:hypothetical protein
MRFVPVSAGSNDLKSCLLRRQYDVVNGTLFGTEATVGRKGASNIAGIAVELTTRIDQNQVTVADLTGVFGVVQDAGIAASRDYGRISRRTAAMTHEYVLKLSLELILVLAWAAALHRAQVGLCRDIRCSLHDLDFCGALVEPHVMEQMVQGHEFVRRLGAQTSLAADGLDPVGQPQIEFLIGAHCIVDTLSSLDQPRQDVIDIIDREGIGRTVFADGAFLSSPIAVPQLALGILFAAEQHVLSVFPAGNQNGDRLRLREAGQILKVTVLTVVVFDIAVANIYGRRRQYGDAVGLHL